MDPLSIVPDFLIAVLAAWLGASIVTRAPSAHVSRVFGLLALLVTLWSTGRLVGRLADAAPDDTLWRATQAAEAAIGAFLPGALLHLVLVLTRGERWGRFPRIALAATYGLGALVAALSVGDLERPIAVRPPYRELLGLPGPALGWGWIAFRALVLGLAVWLAWRAWRLEGHDGPRRGQLAAVLAAVACGAAGGLAMILLRQLGGPDWPGTVLIAVGLGLATYAVFAHRAFLAPDVARRSLAASVGTGLLTAAYVGLLLGLERLSRSVLRIETPLVTAMALVLTIALFDPVRERLRALWDRHAERRSLAYRRLLRALGDELLTSQRPEEAVAPALEQFCRALRIGGAAVIAADGRTVAAYGDVPPDGAASLTLPLVGANGALGQAIFGPQEGGRAYDQAETALLEEAAAFIAASLQLAERQARQAAALDLLTEERAALRAREDALAAALAGNGGGEPDRDGDARLRVYALGPLRVERNGEVIQRWGGAKAGTRQAEAVFAFLFDRGERGVAKDEFVELIWPDVDLDRADLAFHRTLGGLRRMLQPDARRGGATPITYRNDRYRLDPGLIAWSDLAAFEERLAAARVADEPAAVTAALEEARALYRGEYLDDCPFYGDSEHVEERRALLRGRYVDLLLALGERYEAAGDLPAAAACYRSALQAAGNDCPRAEDGLVRLRVPV